MLHSRHRGDTAPSGNCALRHKVLKPETNAMSGYIPIKQLNGIVFYLTASNGEANGGVRLDDCEVWATRALAQEHIARVIEEGKTMYVFEMRGDRQ
jgi:hypothetical protein